MVTEPNVFTRECMLFPSLVCVRARSLSMFMSLSLSLLSGGGVTAAVDEKKGAEREGGGRIK